MQYSPIFTLVQYHFKSCSQSFYNTIKGQWDKYWWMLSPHRISIALASSCNIIQIFDVTVVNIYRLIHGHFHIGLVIILRTPYWPETKSRANMGRGMITRPLWKCPCIKLFITYFRHLEKRHPYWPETKSRPILARANMGLDMEMIL